MTRWRAVLIAAAVITIAVVIASRGDSEGDNAAVDPEAFCRRLDRLAELVAEAEAGPDEVSDVAAARSLASDIGDAAQGLKDTAPEAIADDVGDLADVTVELADELAAFYQRLLDDPERANDPAFLTGFQPVTDERRAEIERAGRGVRPWVEEHCGDARSTTQPSSTTG